jgi:hypothetical protein
VSDSLPRLLDADGEIVRVITASDFLRAAGILDPEVAEPGDLAEFMVDADHFASVLREAKTIVSDELVRRLDKSGKWTRHEGEYTIKAASPAAGTEAYDTDRLQAALTELLARDVIDLDAAVAALEEVRPEPFLRQRQAGIKALLKVPGARDAIMACRVEVEPPKRTVKVTRKIA